MKQQYGMLPRFPHHRSVLNSRVSPIGLRFNTKLHVAIERSTYEGQRVDIQRRGERNTVVANACNTA